MRAIKWTGLMCALLMAVGCARSKVAHYSYHPRRYPYRPRRYRAPARLYKRVSTPRPHKLAVATGRRTPAQQALAARPAPKAIAKNPKARQSATDQHLPKHNTETYDYVQENPFFAVLQRPLSTFSVDVDTASYANIRRMLRHNQRPPKGAVRIEELVNYFPYRYAEPKGPHPFSVTADVSTAPWAPQHRLLRIAIKGRSLPWDKRPPSHLVFLLDVSCSMMPSDKLPLLKRSLAMLTEKLRPIDRVSIVVYAGASGLVLPPTSGAHKARIKSALRRLNAGGSTNGGAGIKLAYKVAREHFIQGGNNRVILATDGDFNVGITSQSELVRLVKQRAKEGIFLSVLGFGMGNYQDSTLEKLADKGNGNYAYIDSLREARKVLVEQFSGTLFTIAKDLKLQLEFNPKQVKSYRLLGYENRVLKKEDFHDDHKDAGDIGAGHTVTAFYELIPAGSKRPTRKVDPLRYQQPRALSKPALSEELLQIKLRYKTPQGSKSKLLKRKILDRVVPFAKASKDFRFASAVVAFGMLLRGSKYAGKASLRMVHEIAQANLGPDPEGYRREFLRLVQRAQRLYPKR